MRTRAIIGGALASAAVIIGAWEVGQSHNGVKSMSTSATSAAAPGGNGSSPSASGYKDGTFTGPAASTRYGEVQVHVTVSGGKITSVDALHLTDADGRSVMISRYAAPLLRQEVLSAQSAQVDTISGATTTSEGYLQSLQAALDEAQ